MFDLGLTGVLRHYAQVKSLEMEEMVRRVGKRIAQLNLDVVREYDKEYSVIPMGGPLPVLLYPSSRTALPLLQYHSGPASVHLCPCSRTPLTLHTPRYDSTPAPVLLEPRHTPQPCPRPAVSSASHVQPFRESSDRTPESPHALRYLRGLTPCGSGISCGSGIWQVLGQPTLAYGAAAVMVHPASG